MRSPPLRRLHSSALPCALVAVSALLASCRHDTEELRPLLPPPRVNGVAATPVGNLQPPAPGTRQALIIRHRILTLQLPLGAASDTEEIWTYINEEPLGSRRGACLGRNGIRVGIGRESHWPEIAKVLRRLTGRRLSRAHMIARPGHPVPVTIRQGVDSQTMFLFRPNGTLFGLDYPPGDNLLVLTAGIDFDNPRNVLLSGAPVVRSKVRRRRYVKGPTGYALRAEPEYFRLEELAFQFNIAPGGFVMIGPGPEVRRTTSPGHCFLTSETRGQRFETLLVIAPEVFVAPIRAKAEPAPPADN